MESQEHNQNGTPEDRPNIFVVDDQSSVRAMVADWLEDEGYDVRTFDSGHEVLETVQEEPPDLLLLDLKMPEVDGLDILEAIREEHPPEMLPVIILSASKDSEDMVEALNQGANDYITKPVDMSVASARLSTHLSLKKAQEQLQEVAKCDDLTGVYNRGHWMEMLEQEFNRVVRYQLPFSLLILDLDHFKRMNDEFGHLFGDRILCSIAELLQEEIRSSDVLCRYGGEEFAVLLPETPMDQAVKLAERLRKNVEDRTFDGPNGERITLTCSIGAAEYLPRDETPEDVLNRADQALYFAKSQGRNRVERRRSKRHEVQSHPARVSLGDLVFVGRLMEYSNEGSKLKIPEPVNSGETVEVEFDHPEQSDRHIAQEGRVVWVRKLEREPQIMAGVEFKKPT